MCDEPDHESLLETAGEPEPLREDEDFRYHFGRLIGFIAGWVVGKTVIELLFPKGDDK
jgi:hypothetical protein